MHCGTSGITDHFAEDEEESFAIVRDVVATLNVENSHQESQCEDPPLTDSAYLGEFLKNRLALDLLPISQATYSLEETFLTLIRP